MSSDKTLLVVLDLRQREEEKALEMLTEAHNSVVAFEQQIAQLKEFETIYVNDMVEKSKNNVDMGTYMSYQQFIAKLETIKERQEAGLVQLQEQENRARHNYLEKQKQRKIIESLLEKHRLQRLAAEAKSEQKLNDEVVSSKMARRLIEMKKLQALRKS